MTPSSNLHYTLWVEAVNSEFRFLEFRVASATRVPDFHNTDSTVPVVVKDTSRTVGANKVGLPCCSANQLAIGGKFSGIERGKIHVFPEDLHAVTAK